MLFREMRRIVAFSILVGLLVSTSFAQSEEVMTISADRPGMATGTTVVEHHVWQWESGLQSDYAYGWNSHLLPTTMLRWGIIPNAELRIQYDGTLSQAARWSYQAGPITVGSKMALLQESAALPAVSLLLNAAIPLADGEEVAPSVYLLADKDVASWLNVGVNVGAEWGTFFGEAPATFLALCLSFGITDSWGAFVESYNYLFPSANLTGEYYADFGANYLLTPRIQLDLYSSFNLQNPKSSANIGLGIAWLIP